MLKIFSNVMVVTLFFTSMLAAADEKITKAQILGVMEASDRAAEQRDTQGIARFLATDFYKYIDADEDTLPVTVRIDKEQYLEFVDEGWETAEHYTYKRSDTVVNLSSDQLTGESYSTVTETLTVGGENLVSKVREYASYKIEAGRPVIETIQTYTLVGDTMPKPE